MEQKMTLTQLAAYFIAVVTLFLIAAKIQYIYG